MASKNVNPAQAKEALNQIKMEAANEVGVTLNQNYNGELTAAQAGKIGGQMVKKMIESFESNGQSAQSSVSEQSDDYNQRGKRSK